MPADITTDEVWQEVEKQMFAVVGMVTARGEARTAGIVYVVDGRELYIGSGKTSWKARHIRQNPNVSLTVTISKRIPFLPWLPIPAATITFQGEATVLEADEVNPEIHRRLTRGMEIDSEWMSRQCTIRVRPKGHFVTYGVGVPLRTMRNPEKSRGRVAVG
jgi:hypothetical protein